MPTIKEDKEALDYVAANPQSEYTPQIMQKLGLSQDDVTAWKWATDNLDKEPDTAVKIRNKVYDKVAESQVPLNEPSRLGVAMQEGGAAPVDRAVVKNLIDQEPDLQEEYLKRKGYKVKRVDDKFFVRREGESRYAPVDPEGFDLWDVTDVAGDVVEGLVSAVTTGAKALGLVGAPVSGGATIPAAMALGAASSGALETAKQTAGIAVGAREQLNPSLIAQKSIIGGTIPGAMYAAGKVMQGGSKLLGSVLSKAQGGKKVTAEAIEAAGEQLGAKATPGMLLESRLPQRMEASLASQTGTIGGFGIRKTIESNKKAVQNAADDIVSQASKMSNVEVGDKLAKQLSEGLEAKLKPAIDTYERWENAFQGKGKDWIGKVVQDNLDDVSVTLAALKDRYKFDDDVAGMLGNLEGKLPQIQSLTDLKTFRTSVRGMLDRMASPNKQAALSELMDPLTKMRSKTLLAAAQQSGNPQMFESAAKELAEADSIYRNAAEAVQNAVATGSQKISGSPRQVLAKMADVPSPARIRKLLDTTDPEKIAKVAQDFPEAFETARQGVLADIAERASVRGEVNPRKLSKIIDGLEPETAALIFGKERVGKAKALKTFLDAMPEYRTSGTAENIQLMNIMNIMTQARSIGQSVLNDMIANPILGKDLMMRGGKALQSDAARGLTTFGVQQVYPDQPYTKRPSLLP